VIPPIVVPPFFFVVTIGAVQHLMASHLRGFDIKSFMLPTAILLGVTGISRAGSLVLDIENGDLDRLLLTPRSVAWRSCSVTSRPTSPSRRA
jgi:ABC-2 type transport system permease protein